ncbi:hypothetical protein NL425_26715, partial [Klebsiella pneumoniae]|nr:hypothetical protein [Klebsiella pneumoniae]
TVGDADLAAEATPGLARRLAVAAAADPAKGGSPSLLRDGGINGSDYVVNASGDPGFPDRLQALSDALTAGRSFDAAGDIATSASLIEY